MVELSKVKDEIVNKYLKDTNLHETKKEAFRIWLKKLEHGQNYFKSNYPHHIKNHVQECQDLTLLDDFEETFKRIVEFQDIDLLDTVNYYADFVWSGNILLVEYEAATIMETLLAVSERIMFDNVNSLDTIVNEGMGNLISVMPRFIDPIQYTLIKNMILDSCRDLIVALYHLDIIGHVKHVVKFNESIYVLETYKL